MTVKARAAVLTSPEKIEIREFPLPSIGDDDGLMRIEACGVCASDIPIYRGISAFKGPVVLGHEIVGTVEKAGALALERWGVEIGDRIVVERWIPCGHCENCYAGAYRLCVPRVDGNPLFYGGSPTALPPALWGGYADYLYLHPHAVVYPVARSVPAVQVPLFTPLANAISWVQNAGGIQLGRSIVIEGPGQVGLAAVLVARAVGADPIIVTGLSQDEERLALARRFGAHTINVQTEDVAGRVAELTGGRMADAVLDVTSSSTSLPLETAMAVAAVRGTIVSAAFHTDPKLSFDTHTFANKGLTLRGVWGRDRSSVFAAIRMLESGSYPIGELTTHQFGLEGTDEALRIVAREHDLEALHVAIVPSGSGSGA